MTEPYTPNPNNKHEQISLLTDGYDPQRAATYNTPYQELADNQAYVELRTLGRIGTSAQMIAKTGVESGGLFIVPLSGTYYYLPSYNPANGSAPWVYPATGMGAGAWLHSMFASLFGGSNPPKFSSSYLPAFPSGTVQEMEAIADADPNELFIVAERGVYRYDLQFDPNDGIEPWVYPATGMGSGAWVNCMFSPVFGSSNPPKIVTALLPVIPSSLRPEFHPYIVARGHLNALNFISPQSITGSVWTRVSPAGVDLGVSFNQLAVGDRLDFEFGPFQTTVEYSGITGLWLRAKVIDGATASYYPVLAADKACCSRRFNHVVSTGPVSVELWAYAYNGTITHPANNEFASFQWAQWLVTRDPA